MEVLNQSLFVRIVNKNALTIKQTNDMPNKHFDDSQRNGLAYLLRTRIKKICCQKIEKILVSGTDCRKME